VNITEKENLLFDEWRKKRDGFVADGVVDQEAYLGSDPKIMFVLKEVNDPDGGDWDLRQFLREGGRPQTWDNVTRWMLGIRKLPEDVIWKDLSQITVEQRQAALKTVCAINLKKSPGGHTTDNQSLWGTSTEDKEFLKKQFDLYDADLTICCGSVTTEILYQLMDFGQDPDWITTSRGIWYHEHKPGHFVIDYAHPEARVSACLLHYGLVDAVNEIMRG
jgi:hypothetical protein